MKEKNSINKGPDHQCEKVKCRWWFAVVALVVASIIAAGLWYFLRNGEEKPSSVNPDNTQSEVEKRPVNSTDPSDPTQATSGDGVDQVTEPDDTTHSGGQTQTEEATYPTEDTQITEDTLPTEDTRPTGEIHQEPTEPSTEHQDEPISDGYISFIEGISVSPVEKYTGMYMEDGSGEIVPDVMMVIVRNDTSSDLQLARIEVQYSEFTAQFQVTNLPAGKSAVVLEKNRRAFTEEEFLVMNIYDVVFFQENMSLCTDRVKVSGAKGVLEIENISSDTFGVVYVYFKNVAADGLLYGGITYRTTFEAGLKPGETKSVTAGHYDPDFTTIMLVQIADNVT